MAKNNSYEYLFLFKEGMIVSFIKKDFQFFINKSLTLSLSLNDRNIFSETAIQHVSDSDNDKTMYSLMTNLLIFGHTNLPMPLCFTIMEIVQLYP